MSEWDDFREPKRSYDGPTGAAPAVRVGEEDRALAISICSRRWIAAEADCKVQIITEWIAEHRTRACEKVQRALESSDSIRHAEKEILIEEIAKNAKLEQRVRELEEAVRRASRHISGWIESRAAYSLGQIRDDLDTALDAARKERGE